MRKEKKFGDRESSTLRALQKCTTTAASKKKKELHGGEKEEEGENLVPSIKGEGGVF